MLRSSWQGAAIMIALKRILIPTDFGETSEAALSYGIALARVFKSQIYLLHVPEDPGAAAEAEYPFGLFDTMQSAAHDRLGHLLTGGEVGELKPECAMRLGKPSEEIVRYAAEHEIDLIVMGTHGREGIARALIGSVAETVVRRASCPVLTLHHPEPEVVMVAASLKRSETAWA
jgi:nucleotide-binding universal stress UspA family protein